MFFDCTCADITLEQWDALMKGRRRMSYHSACRMIKKDLPELFSALSLHLNNPWKGDTYQTKTHIIITHSATEYFIRKEV